MALDDERLKRGEQVLGRDCFEELLERIREIRACERRYYQKFTDMYQLTPTTSGRIRGSYAKPSRS